MTLVTATFKGEALSGYNCFTLDEGRTDAEFVCGSVSGTAVSSLERGISFANGTTTSSSRAYAHRVGANVKITDFPLIQRLRNVLNGSEVLPNLLVATSTVVIDGSSATSTLATKYYVDNVAIAGAPDSGATTKGVLEKATAAEAAAGAADGSGNTTAPLALTASIATSTCQTPNGFWALISSTTTGKLDANCLPTNGALAYTGNNTWTGTSTFSGALDILASTLKPIKLNGLYYNFPSTRAASSTVLSEDGNGNASFVKINRSLAIISNDDSTTSTATTTLRTVVLPANTLTTTQSLRVNLQAYNKGEANTCSFAVHLGNGTATTTMGYLIGIGGASFMPYPLTGTIFSTSTSAQSSAFYSVVTNTISVTGGRVSSYSTTGTLYIAVVAKADAATTCNVSGLTVEQLAI